MTINQRTRISSLRDKRKWWLYVLRLQDEKFYVGITSKTPQIRMEEHLNGIRAAYWTAKHKPIEVIYTKDLGEIDLKSAELQESRLTRELMWQRGINNVRGGDLTSTDKYVRRFGYIIDADQWDLLLYILLLLSLISYLMIEKFVL